MSMRTRIVRRPLAVGSATRPSDDHLNAEAGKRHRLVGRELLPPPVERGLHPVDDRRVEPARQLRLLDLVAHDVAQLGPPPPGRASGGDPRRVAHPVDPLEGRDEHLVLAGVRKDLHLVDAHVRRMVERRAAEGKRD